MNKRIIITVTMLFLSALTLVFIMSGKQELVSEEKAGRDMRVNLDKGLLLTEESEKTEETGMKTAGEKGLSPQEGTTVRDDIVWLQDVMVSENAPDLELKIQLCRRNSGDIIIKAEHWNDGVTETRELGKDQISELQEVSREGEGDAGFTAGFRIGTAVLNNKKEKAYFSIERKIQAEANPETIGNISSVYVYGLKTGEIKRIYEYKGISTEWHLSKEKEYLALQYTDLSQEKKSFFDVINCSGDVIEQAVVYDPVRDEFAERKSLRYSDGIIEDEKAKPEERTKPEEQARPDEQEEKKDESEAMKVLRAFYEMLHNKQYDKAYDLLDDKFQVSAFKILGAAELAKTDIDVQTFAELLETTGVFKTVKVDRILEEKTDGAAASIYYFQSFRMGEGEKVVTPLIAELTKSSTGWKISALKDGDPAGKPFTP